MNLELATRRGTTPHRNPADSIAPTLIRVPALPRSATGRRTATRRRRRLRREVRVAASALLFALPMAGLLLVLGAGHPESAIEGTTMASADEMPSITIGVEPMTPAHGGPTLRLDEPSPTVLIHEIVPDVASVEEAAHAGG